MIKPETYAQAMWFLLNEGEKPKAVVAKVRAALQARGGLALWPRIVYTFKQLTARKMRRHHSALFVARKKDEKTARRESGARDAELVLDPNLIGGWRYEDKEGLIDATCKRHLLALYDRVSR